MPITQINVITTNPQLPGYQPLIKRNSTSNKGLKIAFFLLFAFTGLLTLIWFLSSNRSQKLHVISRIDYTFIYVDEDVDYKEDIKALLIEMGY
jgi:hypothetical protein